MLRIKWVSALFLASWLAASAQGQDDTALVQVLTVSVKPGMNAQFEEFVGAFRDASREQGLDNYWLSAQSLSGDPVYRFHIQRSSWGNVLDPGPQLEEVYGADEARRLTGLLHDAVASEHYAFYQEVGSMTYVPAEGFEDPPEGLIYYDFTLNPGTAPLFQEMATAQKEASSALYPNLYFAVHMPQFGGSGPRTIILLQSLSDLERETLPPGQRLTEHFGEQEGGRLNELAAQSIVSFETQLFRTRPDLNYQPD